MTDTQQSFEIADPSRPLHLVVVTPRESTSDHETIYGTILRFGNNVLTLCPAGESDTTPLSAIEAHALSVNHEAAKEVIINESQGATKLRGGINDFCTIVINRNTGAFSLKASKHPEDQKFGTPTDEARELTTKILDTIDLTDIYRVIKKSAESDTEKTSRFRSLLKTFWSHRPGSNRRPARYE